MKKEQEEIKNRIAEKYLPDEIDKFSIKVAMMQAMEEYEQERVKFISLNNPVSCRYSVSLVYEKEIINDFSTQIDTAIMVLITEAENENEALGKAIKNFEKEMKGYGMKMKVVLPTQNYGR